MDYLYTDKEIPLDAQTLSDKILGDMDTSATLLRYASWEITHQSATWEELRKTIEALDKLRTMLFTSILDKCAYRMLRPDTAAMLRQPATDCHKGRPKFSIKLFQEILLILSLT